MNLFQKAIAKFTRTLPPRVMDMVYVPHPYAAAGYVNKNSTAFAAIDLIASNIANLSFHIYSDTKKRVIDHPLEQILLRPNIDETKFTFFYGSVRDYFDSGNVYWLCDRNADGRIIALYRLNPAQVTVTRDSDNTKKYTYAGNVYYIVDQLD